MKDNIRYILGDENLLDDIRELWEALNKHHREKSLYFKEFYNKFSFDTRKADLLKHAQKNHIRVVISFDEEVQMSVGYCISSLDNDNTGELESIFVLPGHRGFGIGEELMQKGLQWMDEMGAVKKVVNVAAGNEQAFGFYKKYGFYPRKTTLEQVRG